MVKADISSTGGTDISGAIITSTNILLAEQNKGKSIILISDGVNTLGAYVSDPIIEAVDYAKQHQIMIHTIGIGSNQGPIGYLPEYYNISATYNEETLTYMSNQTGGKYFYVLSTDELVQALSYLGENTSEKYLEVNLAVGALLLSICFLFIEWGLANTLYRRVI
jgi:Ca-activated chloride channel family protein